MNIVTIHGEQVPSATFAKTAVDGSNNLSAQFSLAYDDLRSTSFLGFRYAKLASDQVTSATFSQSAVDGTHNLSAQFSLGFDTNAIFVHDASQLRAFGMSSTLSFSGQFWLKLNNVIQIFLSATVGAVGQFIKQAKKQLPEFVPVITARQGLSFRPDFFANPSAIGTTQMFLSSFLNFVAAAPKRSIPSTVSVLSFIGSSIRPHNKVLTAALSFVGLVKKSTLKQFSGILSFLGFISIRPPHVIAQPLLLASLPFTGTVVKKTSRTLMFATLFFSTAKFPRFLPRLLESVVSFAGFGRQIFHLLTQSLTAALSFIGSITRSRGKIFAATLQFVGVYKKSTIRSITAALSFIGAFTRLRPLAVAMTATLSFVGSFTSARNKIFTAVLSFIGTHRIFTPFKRLSAILSFSGRTLKKSPRSFPGALSFIGTFKGSFTYLKLMTATLAFIGSLKTRLGKLFIAILSFTGDYVTKLNGLIIKFMESTMSFVTDLFYPNYFVLFDDAFLDFSATVGKFLRPIRMLLTSALSFRTAFILPWRRVTTLVRCVISTLGNIVIGTISEDMSDTRVVDTTQSLDTTPVALSVLGRSFPILYIQNLDEFNTVKVDTSITFTNFPQIIGPQKGVYLSIDGIFTIYARTQSGTAEIRITAALGS